MTPLPRSILSILTLASLVLPGCNKPAPDTGSAEGSPGADAKGKKIAFVTNGVASFWTIAAAGVKAAARDLNVNAETLMPAEGISDQKRIVEDLLTRGVDGIAISPIDPANQTDLINQAS